MDRAEAVLGADDHCPFCSVTLSVPAAKACADVCDLEHAQQHLQAAEKSAHRWEGTAWQAAEMFAAAGQPLDAQRCHDRSRHALEPA